MTIWIGITGGIGSGKSQAAAEFLHLGAPVIDADAISRQLTAEHGEVLPKIRKTFGDALFDDNACLKREALRNLVFSCEDARKRLEALMHPLILKEIKAQQATLTSTLYGIIELPLLVEKPIFQNVVDRILTVNSSEATRILRVMRRSGLFEENVRGIMLTQADDAQRKRIADDVLINETTLAELQEKVWRLHRYYLYLGSMV